MLAVLNVLVLLVWLLTEGVPVVADRMAALEAGINSKRDGER